MKNLEIRKKLATVTAGEIARHCQVSIPAVRQWMRAGVITGFRTPGGHRRVAEAEFQRFLRAYEMPPWPPEPAEIPVLVVDDEPQIVGLFVDFLSTQARRFKVETATDGYEALIRVGSFHPSLLILDVQMPRLDGIEVCRRLKARPDTRAIRILGVTGFPETIPALRKAGADLCLAKPLDLDRVEQALERLVTPTPR